VHLYWLQQRFKILPMATLALPRERSLDIRLIAALAAVYVIWSSTYLAIRVVIEDMPALLTGSMRVVNAGGVMFAIARRQGATLPSPRDWLRGAPAGVLLFVGGNGFVMVAETSVSSGGAAVVCATMPLWMGVFGVVTGERPTTREWASLLLGFAGVVVLMGGPALAGEPLHIALIIFSPIMWAMGSVLARRTKDVGGRHATLVGSGTQMLVGGLALALAGALRGESLPLHASGASWLAFAYLLVFGSLIGFTAYAWLLRNARPVVATSYAYVNPTLAVLMGAALYGEPLSWATAIANALIVGAIMLGLSRR